MARLLSGKEIFRKLTEVAYYRIATGTIGDTLTDAAIAKGDAAIPVASETNFSAADPVLIIGDGGVELISALGTPGIGTLPIANQKIALAQASGARVVEAVKVPLGKIGEGGFQLSPSRSLTPIPSAVDDLPVAFIEGVAGLAGSFPLLGYNIENLQLLLGFKEDVTGAGTTADPYQGVFGEPNQALQETIVVRMTGLRHDLKTVQLDLLDARIETSGSIDHNRTAPAILPVTVQASGMILRIF